MFRNFSSRKKKKEKYKANATYSFLDESKNTELIRWSDDGNSFIVLDEDEFARTLIPELFKHNNYASFVRQLNMYGFHKKVGLSDNSMRASERKNKSPSEYANPYFKRGHPDLLWLISKPKNAAGHASKPSKGGARVKTEDADENDMDDFVEEGAAISRDERGRPNQLSLRTDSSMPQDQLSGVYRELQAIRQQQSIISGTISRLRKEHEQLYSQAANFQEQHTRHENSINAILTFLATVYNRSLQGGDGTQNIANSFAGAISGDQGNIVDVDDFSFNPLASMASPTGQRAMKKQPLLLKAPPTTDDQNRATTLSPAAAGQYETRSRGHARQPSATHHGHVEEVLDNSPRQDGASIPSQNQADDHDTQRDIMSVIQNSNARNGIPTNFSEFPNVLSSLETSGGNIPLTQNQREDMLRLMGNEINTANPTGSNSHNNALTTPNPPPMPPNYSGRLASTRQEIDNLVKMQAEQDRSVQNLTNLLQPLSPNGTIPGLSEGDGSVPPPPLDLDQIFNNDYFTDIGDGDHDKSLNLGDNGAHESGIGANTHDHLGNVQPDDGDTNDLFDFDHLPSEGDLFDGTHQEQSGYNYGFDGSHEYGGDTAADHKLDSGRVIEQLTDSEATSPAAADEQAGDAVNDGGSAKRRRRA
jgi:heat shock transcription factor